MIITPEILSKLIFATSQLRFFERELVMEPSNDLQDIVIRWQCKIDSLLVKMGMEKYISKEDILTIIKTEFNADQLQAIPAELENRDKTSYIRES